MATQAEPLTLAEASRRSIRAGIAYFPTQVLPALLALVSTPVLTRTLGPREYGLYAIGYTVAMLVVVLASEPTAGSLRRLYAAATPDERPALVTSLARLSVLLSVVTSVPVAAVAAVAAAAGADPDWSRALAAAAAVTLTYPAIQYVIATRYVREALRATTAWQAAHSIGKAAALVTGAAVIGSASAALGAYAVVLAALVAVGLPWRGRSQREFWRRGARYGAPLILSSIAGASLAGLDRILLSLLDSASAAGRYAAAYVIAEYGVLFLMTAAMYAVYPSIVGLWERGDRPAARALARRTTRVYLVLSVMVIAGLVHFGTQAMRIIGGRAFEIPAVVPASVAAGVLLFGLGRFEGIAFELQLQTRTWARLVAVSAAISVPIVVAGIEIAQLSGAGVATVVSYGVFWVLVRRSVAPDARTGMSLRALAGTAVVTALACVVASPLPPLAAAVVAALLAGAATVAVTR
jgi:O-antigen/teichoic acid export membrane protein